MTPEALELLESFDLPTPPAGLVGVILRHTEEPFAVSLEGPTRLEALDEDPEHLKALLEAANPEALLCDDLEEALCAVPVRPDEKALAVYDNGRCLELRSRRDGMGEEGAAEFHDFNTLNAWAGAGTPCFLVRP